MQPLISGSVFLQYMSHPVLAAATAHLHAIDALVSPDHTVQSHGNLHARWRMLLHAPIGEWNLAKPLHEFSKLLDWVAQEKPALRTCYFPLGTEEHNKQTPPPAATLNSWVTTVVSIDLWNCPVNTTDLSRILRIKDIYTTLNKQVWYHYFHYI